MVESRAREEFETMDLGDKRLNERVMTLAETLGDKPGASIPAARGSTVGSRTGAPTSGSGGWPTVFTVALSPAAIVTFPAPATSNGACGFPALRSPACFAARVMGPIKLATLS